MGICPGAPARILFLGVIGINPGRSGPTGENNTRFICRPGAAVSGRLALEAHPMIKKEFSKRAGRDLWKYDIWIRIGGKMYRRKAHVFETRRQAEEAVRLIQQRAREAQYGLTPEIDRPRLADLAARRLADITSPQEARMAKRLFAILLGLLPPGVLVDQISTADLRLFVERRRADGIAPSSINRELNTVAALLNRAGEYFSQLAQWRPPKLPRPKAGKSRRERIITDDEYRRIVEWLRRPPDEADGELEHNRRSACAARQRVAAIFEFAVLTGMRPVEIYKLPWYAIEWDNRRIRVETAKTKRIRYIPLIEPIVKILEEQRVRNPGTHVFTKRGRRILNVHVALAAACKACGIPYGRWVEHGLELYSARHTFTSRLLLAGNDPRLVGDVTGHSDKEMVLHYSHVNAASLERAHATMAAIQRAREGRAAEGSITPEELRAWLRERVAAGEGVVIPARWLEVLWGWIETVEQ